MVDIKIVAFLLIATMAVVLANPKPEPKPTPSKFKGGSYGPRYHYVNVGYQQPYRTYYYEYPTYYYRSYGGNYGGGSNYGRGYYGSGGYGGGGGYGCGYGCKSSGAGCGGCGGYRR